MYQNLIYISRYLDFYYQILNPYLLLPTPPYLPLTTSTPIYPYPPPPLPTSEQFLQGQWVHVPWTYFIFSCQIPNELRSPWTYFLKSGTPSKFGHDTLYLNSNENFMPLVYAHKIWCQYEPYFLNSSHKYQSRQKVTRSLFSNLSNINWI